MYPMSHLSPPSLLPSDNMLLAVVLGLALHLSVVFAVDNKPLAHAAHGKPIRHRSVPLGTTQYH